MLFRSAWVASAAGVAVGSSALGAVKGGTAARQRGRPTPATAVITASTAPKRLRLKGRRVTAQPRNQMLSMYRAIKPAFLYGATGSALNEARLCQGGRIASLVQSSQPVSQGVSQG